MSSDSTSLGSPDVLKFVEDVAQFAVQFHGGATTASLSFALESTSNDIAAREVPPGSRTIIEDAQRATAQFEETGDIQHSNNAIRILRSNIEDTDPTRHHLLYTLALTLRRRVEIQMMSGKSIETLVEMHCTLEECLLLLRQAVSTSPAALDIKIKYLGQLGHTATLWSTILSTQWPNEQVLALLAKLKAERDATQNTIQFFPAVILASTLSTSFGHTKDPVYLEEGREVYRHLLKSVGKGLPIDSILNAGASSDAKDFVAILKTLQTLAFITENLIPFVVQLMAFLMQRLVEIPLSAVVGRQAAAIAMGKGFHEKGTEWLEQCLMLVWGQTNLRAPAPLDATRIRGVEIDEEMEGRMGQLVLAFLGLALCVDFASDGTVSVAHPEQLGYFLMEEWLKLRKEVSSNSIHKDMFKPHTFSHILHAAHTAPVVMLNLWGSECFALLLLGEGKAECFRLEGVTEELAGNLQASFRKGLQSYHFRARGDEIFDQQRGLDLDGPKLQVIHRVLAVLWNTIVKPILDKMKLQPVDSDALDAPRLIWCPTGPTSFFPLHAAGLYDSQERGTKTYEYVASSYTPTLSILANANDKLAQESAGPFRGILAVSQPSMDGQTRIPKTVEEVDALLHAVGKTVDVEWLKDAAATREAVLTGMSRSTWVHLACHAHQYPLRSSESAFILAGGGTLSLADVSASTGGVGELAFLSACQTAAGDFDLAEEGVHLAAGMLVAGYRSVVATAWSVHDVDAPVVAGEVYGMLLEGGRVDRTGAGRALHRATALLRNKVGAAEVMRWAPFIHLGI
ncbi:CHAT domain-containing protein [Mycena crocata]|nr:CHAT domain-containing protein [Mycena crocata]